MTRTKTHLALALAAAVIASGSGGSRAQTAVGPQAHSPAEEEALELLANGLYVSARTKAERVLRDDPDSIVGHYVLGRAFFDAEGSLARAMYHLGRARELHERGTAYEGPFHQELLFQTARLAGQMELYEFQLDLLGYHDHLYDPDMIAERCWPLMKLGRLDEARQFAQTAVGSPNSWQRSAGLNALCAVEGEARSREPYRVACLAALEGARAEVARRRPGSEDEGGGISVDAYNASLAAASALRFTEAEQLALEGVRRFEPTGANPWRLLVELYLTMGRMDDALHAFASMISWNDRQPAALRDQSRADIEATVATVLLFAGESEAAQMRIDRALERPDRRGLTTDGAEQARGRHALLRRMIRRAVAEEAAERASWEGFGARVANRLGSVPVGLATWPDEERVVAVLTDSDRLVDTIRPTVPGGIDGLSPWMTADLIEVLGPAVVAVALREARARDAEEPLAAPFYLALDVELAAARGDEAQALRLATELLPQLTDPGWALVRGRVALAGALSAEDEGQETRANELYATVLETDPGLLRRRGVALPAQIRGEGADAREAASLLEASPRFTDRRGAFELVVEAIPNGLRGCLRTALGNEIRCAEAHPPEAPPADAHAGEHADDHADDHANGGDDGAEEEEDAPVDPDAELTLPQRLAREVHRQLFGTRIELSGIDLSSLDGRTTGGSALANERLRELMGEGNAP